MVIGAIPVELANLPMMYNFYVNENHLDADSHGNALIPPAVQAWYDAIPNKDISNQTISPYLLLRRSWRHKIFREALQ